MTRFRFRPNPTRPTNAVCPCNSILFPRNILPKPVANNTSVTSTAAGVAAPAQPQQQQQLQPPSSSASSSPILTNYIANSVAAAANQATNAASTADDTDEAAPEAHDLRDRFELYHRDLEQQKQQQEQHLQQQVMNQLLMNGGSAALGGGAIGRQGPIKNVKSIIDDYRQKHPETVPRRGRRRKGAFTQAVRSMFDVLNLRFSCRPFAPFEQSLGQRWRCVQCCRRRSNAGQRMRRGVDGGQRRSEH